MWYFEEAGQTTGPLPDPEIRAAVAAGRIGRTTLVWRDGMGGWLPAEQTELASAFATSFAPPFAAPPNSAPTFLPPAASAYNAPPATPPFAAPAYPAPSYAAPAFGAPTYSAPGYAPAAAGIPGVRFAGFWIRFAAYIIDAVFVQAGAYALGMLVGLLMAQAVLISDQSMELTNVQIIAGLVGLAWALGYYLVSQASSWQATPGKRILGLRVVREDGRRVGVGLALGRYLAYIVSGIILGIGFLMIGWTDQKKGLHDMICSTRVVYGRS